MAIWRTWAPLLALFCLVLGQEEPGDEQLLEENRLRDEVTETASGLQYEVVKSGPVEGPNPDLQSACVLHYRGTLLNGTEFDSSYKRNTPARFKPASLMPGFKEALLMMRPGDTWKIWVPSAIGYGSKGAGSAIPPDAGLFFEVEMLEVNPPAEGLDWLWEQALANPMPLALLGLFAFQLVQQYFSKGTGDLKELLILDAEKDEENTKVFLSIKIGFETPKKVEIQLFAKSYPKTAENFRALCTGEKGKGDSGKPLAFKGSTFHRIIPGFMCQGGDFTHGNGRGGESIYGDKFEDEFTNGFISHDAEGLLSMANAGKDTNGSQFFITLGPCKHLDGKHVVFGQVTEGMDVVKAMGDVGTSGGDPKIEVVIEDCGEIKSKST
ncbi:Peptidyl-prolyl cis-trans isomerase (PPIase) (Cyclophilin) (Cyp) (Cyclosporin A-binding protein) (Rotamase) (allergen Cat r 1) [Durusdinium trenchii]|uniref:peptidylprolyl isomerase n=2 Tax=Durusdinium trenchii TaxID=1381693 RepID=A0ABP0SIH0_9DINO